MPAYRIYLLDDTGRIVNAVDAECATDRDALRLGATLAQGGRAEVWEGTRCFGQVPESHDCSGDCQGLMCAECAGWQAEPAAR